MKPPQGEGQQKMKEQAVSDIQNEDKKGLAIKLFETQVQRQNRAGATRQINGKQATEAVYKHKIQMYGEEIQHSGNTGAARQTREMGRGI